MPYDLLTISDRVQEGMRELEPLKDKRDINLCTTFALVLAHKKAKTVGLSEIKLKFLHFQFWI